MIAAYQLESGESLGLTKKNGGVAMDTMQRIQVLQDVYAGEDEIDQIIGKLFDAALGQHYLRRDLYEHDLRDFEQRYQMTSDEFHRRFESGELGDAADYFEWAGLYDLYQDLLARIRRLEEGRWRQLAAEIRESRAAYAQGDVQRGTVDDLLKEAAS